jgi:ABC-type nitrate/sulfonate/bicarbonate transport system substrate-binding protein
MGKNNDKAILSRRRFLQTGAAVTPLFAGCLGGGDGGGGGSGDDGGESTDTPTEADGESTTSSGGGTTSQPDATEVTIGYIPSMAHAPLQKPSYSGGFEDANIEPNYQAVAGSSRLFSLLASGDLDVAGAAVGAAAHNAINRGLPVEVVAPLHAYPPDPEAAGPDPFIVSEKSGITEISQLEGETIGVNTPGSAIQWINDEALRMGGLTIDDVRQQTMPFPDMIPAMDNEAIVGGVIPEPLATVAGRRIDTVRLAGNIRPGALLTATSYNTEWAESNPDAANAFMTEYLRGARNIQGAWTSEENLSMISDYMEVPADLIEAAGKPYIDPNLAIDTESLTALQEFVMNTGELDYDELLSSDDVINPSYRQHAIDELG